MFRLRRFYLDSIGVVDNRFSDLLVDLTDGSGSPTDTIVWLRNGAGKTTMLSLLLALILPARSDFLATRTKKRTLEDLILGTDTAHVVAEWMDPNGHLLLTGAVYEWEGRIRPRDYNGAGKERLKRTWWCVSPDPQVEYSTLDDLPFTLRSNGYYDHDRFKSHIRWLAAQGVNAVVADKTIAEWHRALRERRFDPDLFRYFTEVNAAEGGIDRLFEGIDSPGAFVRYLLRFVADRQRISPVRELLSDTAVEIAKRPTYLTERDFCTEAQEYVSALGMAHDIVLDAADARDARRATTSAYKRGLLDAAEHAAALQLQASAYHSDVEALHKSVRNSGDNARRKHNEYVRIAAEFRVQDARVRLETAKTIADHCAVQADAWGAVADLISLRTEQATLEMRNKTLQQASEEARPLVQAVFEAKSVLAGSLDIAIGKTKAVLSDRERNLSDAQHGKRQAERKRLSCQKQLAALESEQDALAITIERFTTAKNKAIEDGVLIESEELSAAVVRLQTESATSTAAIKRLTSEQQSLAGEVREAERKNKETQRSAETARERHRKLADELKSLEQRATRIADSPRLRALFQAPSVDLLVNSQDAISLLNSAIAKTDAAMVDTRAANAEDERAAHA